MLFFFFDSSSSSSLSASGMDDFIDIKSFILSDMNLISLFDFEIKLEKFSIESHKEFSSINYNFNINVVNFQNDNKDLDDYYENFYSY